MRKSFAMLLMLSLLVMAGCGGQISVATATPSPTSTPDLAATEAQQAFIGAQTAVVDTQATLEAAQTTMATTQTALQTAQAEAEALRDSASEMEATLQAESAAAWEAIALAQTEVMEDTRVLQESLEAVASEQAALASDRGAFELTQAAAAATNEAFLTELNTTAVAQAAQQEALERQAAELATLQAELDATQAARQAATLVPEMPAAEWQTVYLDRMGLTLMIPPEFVLQEADEHNALWQRTDDPAWPSTIQLQQQDLDGLFGGNVPPDLDASNPVTVLEAGIQQLATDEIVEILDGAAPFSGAGFPAAIANTRVLDADRQMTIVLLRQTETAWLGLLIMAQEADLAQWVEPIARSISPLEAIPVTPVAEPTTSVPEDATAAIGVQFSAPDGWTTNVGPTSGLTYPSIELSDSNGSDNFIGLLRFTAAEFTEQIAELPTGLDAQQALGYIVDAVRADMDGDISGGRVNEFAIEAFVGAWTQLRDETESYRLYLFELGEDEWLLVAAFGPRDSFNAFSRAELREFLQSLEPLADQGVALGLNFDLPQGWEMTEPTIATAIEPASVNLKPAEGDDLTREIIVARGESAQFGMLNLPADAPDASAALQPVAEAIRDSGDLGTRLRVEPIQIGMFNGAFASLRGENNAARVFLFDLSGDDWLLIVAYARADAFNAFSRAELKDFLGSLSLASGAEATLRVEPIGPIEEAVVSHVSDGDTVYVMLNGVEESVRIIGIDTPEAHHPDYGVDHLGYAATHYMLRYIDEGSTVYLESDVSDRDDFDRLLRYVWIKDDAGDWVMLEAELIRAGMAHVRTYDEDRYVPYFHALEREAQAERLGVWGDPPPPPPTDSLAEDQQRIWVANPAGENVPLLFDAAALGNVPDPVAVWPNGIPAVVEDVYYVYPTDIDPVTGEPVSADRVGYWYWLEINDFRGWVPESWLLLEEPQNPAAPPDTDIIAYAEPFVVSEGDLAVLSEPGSGEVLGTYVPESRVMARRIGIDPASGEWWVYTDTQTVDGWVPLANLNRLSPENR